MVFIDLVEGNIVIVIYNLLLQFYDIVSDKYIVEVQVILCNYVIGSCDEMGDDGFFICVIYVVFLVDGLCLVIVDLCIVQ